MTNRLYYLCARHTTTTLERTKILEMDARESLGICLKADLERTCFCSIIDSMKAVYHVLTFYSIFFFKKHFR